MSRWKPSVTVAALIEAGGRFLLVEERTPDGVRLNQPAGHLDPGESLVEACARETLEETAYAFKPTHLLGVYQWRQHAPPGGEATTYLRFAFIGTLGAQQLGRRLDPVVVRTLWLDADDVRACGDRHRSPLVQQCIDDYLAGHRFPLSVIHTHPDGSAGVRPGPAQGDA